MYFREDQADIRLSVDGVPFGDSWKTFAGGELSSDNTKTRPGGMGHEVDVGGQASRGDVTIETQMTDVSVAWVAQLETKVGNGDAKVSLNFLRPDRSSSGRTFTVTGTVKTVTVPDMGGSSDVGMLSVVVSCNELAT